MTTLTRLNSDMGDILLTNLNTPAQDCSITMPVISGKSAYDLALENGYVGSLQDWLSSLSGWKPIDSDFANYLEQQLQLSSLFNNVNSQIEANKAELDTRIEERISEAHAINTKLENEAQERIREANELAKQLLDETAQRVSDVSKLRDDLQSEAYERALAMDQLADDILSEQVTRVNELKDLGDFIDSLDSKVNTNHTFLLEHYSTASTTTSEIANKIDALKTTYIDPALNTKATVTAVEQVQTNISKIDGELVTVGSKLDGVIAESGKNKQDIAAVWTDMQVRVTVESALSTRIDNVVATTYDHDARIVAETKSRTDADSAMASDIRAVTARVGTTEGKITTLEEVTNTTNSSLSQVSTKLDNLVNTVDGKASSQALTDVSSRVSNAEGTLTSQGQAITKLTNDLDTTNNAVNTKASADSVSALTNRVTETEGKVTSNSNALTVLTNRVITTEGEITKKADASVLVDYYTKTKADEAIAGEISKFNGKLRVGSENLITKAKWNYPAFYTVDQTDKYEFKLINATAPYQAWAFFGTWDEIPLNEDLVFSFKIKALDTTPLNVGGHTYGISGGGTVYLDGVLVVGASFFGGSAIIIPNDDKYHLVTVFLTKTSTAIDYIYIQPNRATGYNNPVNCSVKEVMLSYGNTYIEWVAPNEFIQDQLDANATAVSGLTTRVTTAEGNITSQGTSITNLQNNVSTINNSLSTKADSSAVSTLDNKVSSIDGRTTANANSITSLQGNVDTINGTLTTKADSSALNNYYTKQDSDSAIAGKISEFKTNYVLPELGKKFDASAISSYYNKSDTDSAITSKIDSFKANYVDSELGKKFNASAISNYLNKAETNQAITTATTELNASLAKKVSNDDIPSIVELSQTGKRHSVSTVGLDENTYYPVCFNVNDKKSRITMSVSLGQSKASWATHGAGWSGHIEITQRASGWGGNVPDITIERFAYYFCAQSPVISVGQISAISKAIFHLRGGTEYFFYVDNNVGNPELYTSRHVFYEQYNVYCEPITYDKSLEPKSFKTDIQNNASALTTLKAEVKEVDGKVVATASKLENISTTVGSHTTSIQQHSESINGIKANWSLKLNANGRVSGMTLMNDGRTSEFAIEADNFYVGAIDSAYKPFQVKTVGWTGVDGRSYPSGVYINNAVIGDLDAKVIRAGTITGDKIEAGSITGDRIKAGSITADRIQIGSITRDRIDNNYTTQIDNTKTASDRVTTAIKNSSNWDGVSNTLTVSRNNISGGKDLANLWTNQLFDPAFPSILDCINEGKINHTQGSNLIRLNARHCVGDWSTRFYVKPGEQYIISCIGYNYSGVGFYTGLWITDDNGGGSTYPGYHGYVPLVQVGSTGGGWKFYEAIFTVPVGYDASTTLAARAHFFQDTYDFSVVHYKIANLTIKKVIKESGIDPQLVNRTIQANNIAAGARDLLNRWKANGNGTLFIDDNHIAVNKIGANEIAAGAITADHIYGGTITGDKIKSGSVTADKIDTRGLSIKDNNGNVLFSAGTALNVANITGLGSLATKSSLTTSDVGGLGTLATKNTVTTGEVTGLGSFATVNKLTAANITTYVDGLGVKNLLVGDAQITSANIGTAQVDTLQIAGEAVVVPRAQYNPNELLIMGDGNQVKLFTTSLDTLGGAVSVSLGFERIYASFDFPGSTSYTFEFYIKLYRNGVEIKKYKINFSRADTTGTLVRTYYSIDLQLLVIPTFLDTPPLGANIYEVYANWETSNVNASRNVSVKLTGSSIQLLGVKR